MVDAKDFCEVEVKFLGFLKNVDDSVLEFDFGNGFKAGYYTEDEARDVFQKLESASSYMPVHEIFIDVLNFDTHRVYYLEKNYKCKSEIKDGKKVIPRMYEPSQEVVFYLSPLLHLMRLFTSQNIIVDRGYIFVTDIGHPGITSKSVATTQNFPKFHINSNEVKQLKEFVNRVKTTKFDDPAVQLAFDNFNWSFETFNLPLSFLAIINGLEALFNPADRQEISFRISRNCAILLGKENKQECQKIFKLMRGYYKLRSQLVHGTQVNISQEDIIGARHLLGESIKEFIRLKKERNTLLKELDELGFGLSIQ